MVNKGHESRKLTYRVPLPGEQRRLKELVLYIAGKAANMERFGLIKLNKILWKSDFSAFRDRNIPVTGRAYQRLKYGPAPVEMPPLLAEMTRDRELDWQEIQFGTNSKGKPIVEKRAIPLVEPIMRWFSSDDLTYVDAAIEHYRFMTGMETSDDSHGIAWRSREDLDPMPYEAAFFSDQKPSPAQLQRTAGMAAEYGWKSN